MAQRSYPILLNWKRRSASLAFISQLLLFSLLKVPDVRAQQIGIQTFGLADGLVGNVTAISQDKLGRLWVGTDAGLLLYSESGFDPPNDAPGKIKTGWVKSLLATPDGGLWVGLDGGLYRLTPTGDWQAYLPVSALPELNSILFFLRTADGMIWAGGREGVAYWNGKDWQIISKTEYPLTGITAMAEAEDGQLWLAVETQTGNQVWVLDRNSGKIQILSNPAGLPDRFSISAIVTGQGQAMWVATDSGLVKFEGLSRAQIFSAANGLASDVVFSVLPHPDGGVWVGTTLGLQRLGQKGRPDVIQTVSGLPGTNVRAMLYDNEGGLWLCLENGLARLPGVAWQLEDSPPVAGQPLRTFLAGPPGKAYAAGLDHIYFLDDSGNWQAFEQGLHGELIATLARDSQGNIWAGTNRGLLRLEGQTWMPDARVPSADQVNAILARADGLWVGTTAGVYQLQKDSISLHNHQSGALGMDNVTSIWPTRSGDLWVGTVNGGASRWNGVNWMTINRDSTGLGLADNIVLVGLEDSAGNLWFGTRDGLSRLQQGADPTRPDAWSTQRPPALGGTQIQAIHEDVRRPGLIWVGTQTGLNLIDGLQVSTFTIQDGLPALGINSIDQSGDGTPWVGTNAGLYYHHDAGQGPRMVAFGLKVNQQSCMDACLDSGITYRTNSVEMDFSGLDLASPGKLLYQVVLERQNKANWEPVERLWSDQTSLTRTLPPGWTYRFTVQAYDRDFNASIPGSSLAFTVPAATPWEWLFDHPVILILLILALILVGIIGWNELLRFRYYKFPLDVHIAVESRGAQYFIQAKTHSGLLHQNLPYQAYMELPELLEWERILREDRSVPPLKKLGEALAQAIFPAQDPKISNIIFPPGRRAYKFRLSLDLRQAQMLKPLPWEVLYGGQKADFLAVHSQVAILRDLSAEVKTDSDDLAPGNINKEIEQASILTAWSNPRDMAQLFSQDQTVKDLKDLLDRHLRRKRLVLQPPLGHVRWEQFDEGIKHGCTILQFEGHGSLDPASNSAVLFFEDQDHDAVPIPGEQVVSLIKALEPAKRPRLVFLNACSTAAYNSATAQGNLAEALISDAQVAAVIGMGYPIPNEAARVFSKAFYEALLDNGQVDYAMMAGRKSLAVRFGVQYRYWAIPRLYCSIPDGEIFRWK